MYNLNNKKIIITGASSGIGKVTSILASRAGASLIIIGRDKRRLKDTLNSLNTGKHSLLNIDLTDFSQLENEIIKIVDQNGPLDGFVHCAGLDHTIPLRNTTPEKFLELYKINSLAAFELARQLSKPKHYNRNGSSFIFVSSIMGSIGQSGKIGYCSSKGSLIAGMKGMAIELATKNIRVNCVSPGIVNTELVETLFTTLDSDQVDEIIRDHPIGIGQPEDVAQIICFLLSDAGKWFTGSNVVIDGGYSAK